MTVRRARSTRKTPFEKEGARHFRLANLPPVDADGSVMLSFDDMFEEYKPENRRRTLPGLSLPSERKVATIVKATVEDDAEELVDIDAELDQYAEDHVDIEADDTHGTVGPASYRETMGEAAKYGILYDDRHYDYTKHLRAVGVTPGAVFIPAPGHKKPAPAAVKPVSFFPDEAEADTERSGDAVEEDVDLMAPEVREAESNARHLYHMLLRHTDTDPALKEALEALEDERYVTEDFGDDLVLSLDNMDISMSSGEDDIIDIVGTDKVKSYIPSVVLKKRMDALDNEDDFETILDEYDDSSSETQGNVGFAHESESVCSANEIDIEEDSDGYHEIEDVNGVLEALQEKGRARGTSIYERKRLTGRIPPIHVAIAQYDEMRRDMIVDNADIVRRYAAQDEEEAEREAEENERILETIVKTHSSKDPSERSGNIQTARRSGLKGHDQPVHVPMVIRETLSKGRRSRKSHQVELPSTETETQTETAVNKGIARATDETLEDKRARKTLLRESKRERRAEKKASK